MTSPVGACRRNPSTGTVPPASVPAPSTTTPAGTATAAEVGSPHGGNSGFDSRRGTTLTHMSVQSIGRKNIATTMEQYTVYPTTGVFDISDREQALNRAKLLNRHQLDNRFTPRYVPAKVSYFMRDKTFVISESMYKVVYNKKLQQLVAPMMNFRTRYVVKWMPNQKRFDMVEILYSKGKKRFFTVSLTDLYSCLLVDREDLIGPLRAWMQTVSDGLLAMGEDVMIQEILAKAQYPLLRGCNEMGDKFWIYPPNSREITPILKRMDLKDAMRIAVGKRKYPRRLTHLVAQAILRGHFEHLGGLRPMLDLGGYDHVLDFAEVQPEWYEYARLANYDSARHRFLALSYQRQMRILQEEHGINIFLDACRMADTLNFRYGVEVNLSQWASPTQMHNRVMAIQQHYIAHGAELRAKHRREMPIPAEPYEALLSIEMPHNIKLVRPETAGDMDSWGNEMNFCIGSYSQEAIHGNGLFFAIYREEQLMGCGHIANKRIVQMLGKHNSYLPDEIRYSIHDTLVSANLINADLSGWGMQ